MVYLPGCFPGPWMMEAGEYTMKRFAGLYGMEYMGMITSVKEARKQTMGDK